MYQIKFGTDGWRAIIGKDYTTDNVNRVSCAVASWLLEKFEQPTVVIGHDCRFAGKLFMEEAARVFLHHNIRVIYAEGPVSTPVLSLATLHFKASLGVVITASHNPADYNGYKLKGNFGGPLLPEDITDVENRIPAEPLPVASVDLALNGNYIREDFTSVYIKRLEEHFDLELIRNSEFRFAYDAMYGAGQVVMEKILPEIELLHCELNPGFGGIAPEPILRNLQEFSEFIRVSEAVDCGLATDGDADRIGLFDSKGNFVDSHHIILLLIHYLAKYKGLKGKVITAFSVTEKLKKLCEYYHLSQETTKIGFKYITGHILAGDVLLGGEESGGIAVKTHIPERDGIWMGLILWEFMAKTGKTLEQLVQEVYDIVGAFYYDRIDLHLTEDQKQHAVAMSQSGEIAKDLGRNVVRTEDLDGYKFHFDNDAWLLIRASGTEPVLRIYAETAGKEETAALLEMIRQKVISR